jgi:hypothetical protein
MRDKIAKHMLDRAKYNISSSKSRDISIHRNLRTTTKLRCRTCLIKSRRGRHSQDRPKAHRQRRRSDVRFAAASKAPEKGSSAKQKAKATRQKAS